MVPPDLVLDQDITDIGRLAVAVHADACREIEVLPAVGDDGDGGPPNAEGCADAAASGGGFRLVAAESGGHLGIGGKLWDSTWVLVDYLRAQNGTPDCLLAGKHVLELGAGTGVLGMAVARFAKPPTSVVITDLPQVVPLLDLNLRLNGFPKDGPATAAPLAWGSDDMAEQPLDQPCEGSAWTVIMSDVVYEPTLFPLLIETLGKILPPPRGASSPAAEAAAAAVMGYRRRNPDEWKFFRALREAGFACVDVAAPEQQWAPKAEDHVSGEGRSFILRISRQRE
eukprot:SAG22_NODE_1329_length_4710_cov_1.942095_3_plen_283_part_00